MMSYSSQSHVVCTRRIHDSMRWLFPINLYANECMECMCCVVRMMREINP